jgi:ubiquinone/menaquinone biosynthesis C-methylase UbiE
VKLGAWLYDALLWPLGMLGLARARRRMFAGLRGRVLEVGAGTGLNLRATQDVAAQVVAIDRNLDFLLHARSAGARAHLVCADAQALPFRAGAFDAAVETLVFCSVPSPATALAEIRRALRPGGELRMLDHVLAPGRVLGPLQRALGPAWLAVTGDCHLDRDLGPALRESGLRIEKRELRLLGVVQEVVAASDGD